MQALGLIETKGTLAAIEAADAMLKAADVSILEKTKVGGGRTNVSVTGDVAAVKAAVDAGAAAVGRLGLGLLLSTHVIPRPHEELQTVIGGKPPQGPGAGDVEQTGGEEPAGEEELEGDVEPAGEVDPAAAPNRQTFECLVSLEGAESAVQSLISLKVTELRTLAREYPEFDIAGREISKANKNLLLTEFRRFYGHTGQ